MPLLIPQTIISFSRKLRLSLFTICGTIVPIVLVGIVPAHADTISLVSPGSGAVEFNQIDFPDAAGGNAYDNSDVGNATALSSQLLSLLPPSTTTAYVNVTDPGGNWLVRNLAVFSSSISDWDRMNMRFPLPVPRGTNVTSLGLRVTVADTPQASAPTGATSLWNIGDTFAGGGGAGDAPLSGWVPAPDVNQLIFNAAGPPSRPYVGEFGYENVQAAKNQCTAMAVANSLDWLRGSQGVAVPGSHNHRPGLRGEEGVGSPPTFSLVGKLDEAMQRDVNGCPPPGGGGGPREQGCGVMPFNGKLKYLRQNGLADALVLKHQGSGTGTGGKTEAMPPYPAYPDVQLTGAENVTRYGITSYGQGATVTWEWLCDEIKQGEDVEIVLRYDDEPGEPHARQHLVNMIGCMQVFGARIITYLSDMQQTHQGDPTDTLGTDIGLIEDYMINDHLLLSSATIVQALSESPIPEPATLLLLAAGGLFALPRGRRRIM